VDGDLSCLNIIANALVKFQSTYGIIPNVKCKGVGARKVLQRMMHRRVEEDDSMERDQSSAFSSPPRSEIELLFV
jgi:hypothetical protein